MRFFHIFHLSRLFSPTPHRKSHPSITTPPISYSHPSPPDSSARRYKILWMISSSMEAIPIYSKLKIRSSARNKRNYQVPISTASTSSKSTASWSTSSRIPARKAISTLAHLRALTQKTVNLSMINASVTAIPSCHAGRANSNPKILS